MTGRGRRGRPPKKNVQGTPTENGISSEDVYNFNAEIEDNAGKEVKGNKKRFSNIDDNPETTEFSNVEIEYSCHKCLRNFKTERGFKRHMRACEKVLEIKQELEEPDNDEEVVRGFDVSTDEDGTTSLVTKNEQFIITEVETVRVMDVVELNDVEGLNIKQDPLRPTEDGKCDCCGEDIETAHLSGDYSCPDCCLLFMTENGLLQHRQMLHNEELYCCSKCDARFQDKKSLKAHVDTHTVKAVSCPVCHMTFSRKYHLIRHNMQKGCDGSKKTSFPCQVCHREFTRKDNLREHLRAHAGQTRRKKRYTCEFCNKECVGASMLIQHRRMHTGDRPYTCDICAKCFSNNGALKKHQRKHTGERPYRCQQCPASFAAKETLNRHMRIHTGDKPHSCLFCGKRFIQASQLRAHIFHHTGEYGFKCETCGQIFNRKGRLDLHIKFVHEGAEPFICNDCGKSFLRKDDLQRHYFRHSGVKEHACPICSKAFAAKASLKIHLLTHTKEPPRSCDECGRAFIRQDCLLRHMRTKHREKLVEIMADAEKKKLQAQLLAVAAASAKEEEEGTSRPSELQSYMSDDALTDAISQLLMLLVDETTLASFGWPNVTVDKLLEYVIRRCGHAPTTTQDLSYTECLRENAKLLFTAVIDDSAVKTLLNNQTVDEVILHVLKLAKS